MASIRQNQAAQPLPDFRNAGVMLRILLGVNLLAGVAALLQSNGISDSVQHYIDLAPWVQPLLLFNLALLALLGERLRRVTVWLGRALVVLLAAASAVLLTDGARLLLFDEGGWQRQMRAGLLGGMAAAFMLTYLALRLRALSPSLAEARLLSLSARIRPHFLFNSLNAVISLIRLDPRRAETAIEELAELFRALMREPRDLVPLADEIALCRQYLDLETLRLGDRLKVEWQMVEVPLDLEVPPLLLQPLLENAIYHGIEPAHESGVIRVRLLRRGDELQVEVVNPCAQGGDHQRGNHMALDNIRERLALYYDLEARLEAGEVLRADGCCEYRVLIVLPCRGDSP
jgi:two-component system sensor histidine kinase AlgZ